MNELETGMEAEPGWRADQARIDRAWLRIGIGLAVAGQAMVFSLAVNLTPAEGAAHWVVHGGLIGSTLLVLFFIGGDLLGGAWSAVRERRVSIDLLFLVTLLGALGGSLISSVTGTGAVYYEVVAVLIVVHTAGRMLGARSRLAALRTVGEMRSKFDRCRVLKLDGGWEEKAVENLEEGEAVVVTAGQAIPVDGEIVTGRGYVQEASMTGEWRPVGRGPGEAVHAGTFSVDGRFTVRAKAGPRRLDAILAEVERARMAPNGLQEQADRLMRWFLPVVIGVSVATLVFWWGRGPWDRALFNAMAVLLVACPCALGLATPVAVWGGLARLATFGVVARTGDFLAALARVDTVCVDKTGTLSGERLEVVGWGTEGAWAGREGWLQAAVWAVEREQGGPVAGALAAWLSRLATESGAVKVEVLAVETVAGQGVVATVTDGSGLRRVAIGERGLGGGWVEGEEVQQKTIYVTVDGEEAARVRLGESWRAGMVEGLRELSELGLKVEIVTGDPHPPGELGAVVHGGVTPDGKLARVKAWQAEGRVVLFAGDGVNDAAALGAADASVAMGGGSDLARAAAQAVFTGEDLRFLARAVRLARRVVGGIRGNMVFAGTYNGVGMALAAGGLLHPVAAALLMVGSSAMVSVRALRGAREEARV